MAQSKDRIMALLRRWVISLFKSIERPSSWKRKREILFPKKKTEHKNELNEHHAKIKIETQDDYNNKIISY